MSSNEDYNSSTNVSMYKTLSSRAMVLAIIVLFSVVIFMLFLHLIAKWYWRYARLNMSRRSGFIVVGSAGNRQQFSNLGLDQSVIDSLPTFKYHVQSSSDDGNDDAESMSSSSACECAVCLSEFREAEAGRTLPGCNHSFHVDCIDMWLHFHSTCPLCRADVLPCKQGKDQTICAQDTSPLPVSSSPLPVSVSTMPVSTSASSVSTTIPSPPMQSMLFSMSSVSPLALAPASPSPLPNSEPNGQEILSNEVQFDHLISIDVSPCANNGNGNDIDNDTTNNNNNIVFFNEAIHPISEENSPTIQPETASLTPDISIDIPVVARHHPWQKARCLSMPRSCQANMDMELSSNSQPAKFSWVFRQSFKLGRQWSNKGRSVRVFPSNVQNRVISDHQEQSNLESAQQAFASTA